MIATRRRSMIVDRMAVTRGRAAQIWEMTLDGKRSHEIGRLLGVSGSRVRKIAEDYGIALPGAQVYRLAFTATDRQARIIFDLAQQQGVSNAEIISKIVGVVVADGLDATRRKLGKTLGRSRSMGVKTVGR